MGDSIHNKADLFGLALKMTLSTHSNTLSLTHTQTHIHMSTLTHTQTHTRTHTHIGKFIHTDAHSPIQV